MRSAGLALFGAMCVLAGMAVGGLLDSTRSTEAIARSSTEPITLPEAGTIAVPDFSVLAEKVKPAVVNISTTRTRKNDGGVEQQLPAPWNELLRRYFGPNGPGGGGRPAPRQQNSLGSGFLVSADGIVVTNNHVVEGADEIQVVFEDEKSYDAEVLGTDEDTDLAVLKIVSDEPFEYLAFGDSDAMKVGQWVLAVGQPFGLNHTFTSGIVSAKGRTIGGRDVRYQDFIQTDASINPGNSGGPLLNLKGQVIGVNTAIFSRTGQSAGIGFAIPSNLAAFVIDQLKSGKKVVRGYLGVRIQGVDEDIAAGLGLDSPRGALVTHVFGDSPAGKAGVKVGDLITSFNGHEIRHFQELPVRVSTVPPGTKVGIVVLRDGKEIELDMKLAALPDGDEDLDDNAAGEDDVDDPENVLGIAVRPLNNQDRDNLELDRGTKGLIVQGVEPDSAAFAAGIRGGQVLLRANGSELDSVDDLEDALKAARKADKKALLLLVRVNGQDRFVGVELDD